jgi:hypothetical protein
MQNNLCMAHEVTERFVKCVEHLVENQTVKSIRQFALSLDAHPQNVSLIFSGKRDVTIDLVQSAIQMYDLNPSYIFKGKGTYLCEEDQNIALVNEDKIHYVPVAAHAGYAEQYNDPVFLGDLVKFSLPDYKFYQGEYRCFDIAGDSMEPSLFAGEKVVCSLVEFGPHRLSLRTNHVYVIVLESGVLVKRVTKSQDGQSVQLISDNDYYEPYLVPVQEIKQIWYVEIKISPFMPSPNNMRQSFHNEMDEMRRTIVKQADAIVSLNQTMEKMLKMNRSMV